MNMKTIEQMTLEEQVKRLVGQRNALWRLIDGFVSNFAPTNLKTWVREDEDLYEAEVELDEDDGAITVTLPVIGVKLREVRIASDQLYKDAEKIVGNTYEVEGYNPRTGDLNASDEPKGYELYVDGAGEPW